MMQSTQPLFMNKAVGLVDSPDVDDAKIASHRPSNKVTSKSKLEMMAGKYISVPTNAEYTTTKRSISKPKFDGTRTFGQTLGDRSFVSVASTQQQQKKAFNLSVYTTAKPDGGVGSKFQGHHQRVNEITTVLKATRTMRSDQASHLKSQSLHDA